MLKKIVKETFTLPLYVFLGGFFVCLCLCLAVSIVFLKFLSILLGKEVIELKIEGREEEKNEVK